MNDHKAITRKVLRRGRCEEEPYVLDPKGVDWLMNEIDRRSSSSEIFPFVESILLGAELLKTRGHSPNAAAGLFAIAARTIVVETMEELNAGREAEIRESRTARASAAVGTRRSVRRAPRHGQRAPEGSLKAAIFQGPKRL